MKMSSLHLIRFFRRFFAVLRISSALIVGLSPITLVTTRTSQVSAELVFAALPHALQPSVPLAAANGTIELNTLTASVRLKAKSSHPGIKSLERKVAFVGQIVFGLIALLLFDTFWRLFRNAEQGAIFTPENVALLYRLGFAMIVGGVIWEATALWSAYQLTAFLSAHGVLQGVTLGTPLDYAAKSAGELLGAIGEGAFVLILAEVFRRGLKLQQEADLTV